VIIFIFLFFIFYYCDERKSVILLRGKKAGADPAVGRAGLKPPYRCRDNGVPP
jgi:hypothetical protein